ncbi:hypothetical protein [Microbacterium sp. SORGH_AS_0505]|uniref:hypothetical protein n=1 Tax=Microbacterium sp. SORGH_AS_0505 TaxID=3041770 RepID=UPI0027D8E66B|nr:hypothetical protein [Microbacterium sp. SORGH_AS_0505]
MSRRGRVKALVAVAVAALLFSMGATPAQAATSKSFSKAVSASGSLYLTAERVCMRYAVSGTMKYTTNLGGGGGADVYVVNASLNSPEVKVSFTTNCSSWTYVKARSVTAKLSVYSSSCEPSLSAGLTLPWAFSVGVSLSCASGQKTATGTATDSVDRTQYRFTNQGVVIKLPAESNDANIGSKTIKYCSRVGLKLGTTLPAGTANPAARNLSLCSTVANPFYGG